ncbi:kinase-like domain-containing protein [Xylaria sp. FL1777]|nr:kinase-like domain-containing protein [Xylaria sp. FL1777]
MSLYMADSIVLGTNCSAFDRPRLFVSTVIETENVTAPCNLMSFLAVVQKLRIPFLPVTWQCREALVGVGATSKINQALFDRNRSVVFKRVPEKDKLDEPVETIYRRFINEVMVLYHPSIQNHSNILSPIRICWDISPREKPTDSRALNNVKTEYDVWPVLVFEKSSFGDLYQFSSSQDARDLDIIDRLKICLDIGSAISHMQSSRVIHGDIKPQDVLIFQDSQSGFFLAKVADFGFSTWYNEGNDQIVLSGTQLWCAPEATDYPHFTPAQAMKTDVFSFGILCLWFMFEKQLSGILPLPQTFQLDKESQDKEEHQSLRMLWNMKREGCLTRYATQLVFSEADLSSKSKQALQSFFTGSLEYNPQSRECDIKDVLHYLDIDLSQQATVPRIDFMSAPASEDFNVCYSLPTYFMYDYRVRFAILQNLEKLVLEYLRSALSKQLILCYELGFGCSDEGISHSILQYDEHDAQLQLREAVIDNPEYPSELSQYPKNLNSEQSVLATIHQQSMPILIDKYVDQNMLAIAADIARNELTRVTCALGIKHPVSVIIKHVLAFISHTQGRLNDARELTEEVLEVYTRELGKEHPTTLTVMAQLASIYDDLSDFKKAEEIGSETISLKKKVLGDEHTMTLTSMENFAVTFENQTRSIEAERVLIGVIDALRKIFGREHLRLLGSMGHMVLILLNQGRMEEAAAKWGHEAMRIANMALEPDDLGSLNIMAVTVNIYISERRFEDAETLQTQVLERVTKALGHEHPDRLTHMHNLALIWNHLGRPWEAKDLLTSCVEVQIKTLGHEHASTKESLELLEAWKRDETNWRSENI